MRRCCLWGYYFSGFTMGLLFCTFNVFVHHMEIIFKTTSQTSFFLLCLNNREILELCGGVLSEITIFLRNMTTQCITNVCMCVSRWIYYAPITHIRYTHCDFTKPCIDDVVALFHFMLFVHKKKYAMMRNMRRDHKLFICSFYSYLKIYSRPSSDIVEILPFLLRNHQMLGLHLMIGTLFWN